MVRFRQARGAPDALLVKDIRDVKPILRNVNWDFYQRTTLLSHETRPFNCRKYHWFPATFVPEIPFTLVEVLTLPRATVYDPFAGIGTTYFQALLLNRRPLATEICRVAIEFMRSLFCLFDPRVDTVAAKESIEGLLQDYDPRTNYISEILHNVFIEELRPWYSERTLNQLSYAFLTEAKCRKKAAKALLRISISAILKTASSQDRGWGCIADNVLPKRVVDKEALDLVLRHVGQLVRDISSHVAHTASDYGETYQDLAESQTIVHEDVRTCKAISDNSVDLVVTSPPYPNMTDYVTSQRLSYYYLGQGFLEDRNQEIGARSKRMRKDALDSYLESMMRANEIVSKKMKHGGYACYVMPEFGTDNRNDSDRRFVVQRILSGMTGFGLTLEGEYERILPTKRRSHNIKWATLEKEKIYLFRKEG